MAGPRQPVELVIAKGKKHLTKAEISSRKKAEIKANSDDIRAPDYLNKKQKERFVWLASQLVDIEILTNLDVECLARHVQLEDQYTKITRAIGKMGVINPYYEDHLAKQVKVHQMITRSSSELGLTISSRCKLVVPKKEEPPKNKFDKFGARSG